MVLKRLGSSRGVVVALLAAAAVCGGLVYVIVRERQQNTQLSGSVAQLREQQSELEEAKGRLEQTLKGKETELQAANTANYRADMLKMQDGFKGANQKLHKIIRERAELENTNFILDSRLKNMTKELTRSLEELGQARVLLSGTENPHKVKMVQLSESLKKKEQESRDLQGRLQEMERALMAYRAQGEDYSQGAQRYQERMEVLSRNIANLRSELVGKNRELTQKDVKIRELEQHVVRVRSEAEREQAAKAAETITSQRQDLERQVTATQEQLKGKEEELASFHRQMEDLRRRLYDREAVLAEMESRYAGFEQQIAASQQQLMGKEQQLDTLQQQLADLKGRLHERETMLAERENDVAQARLEIKELEEEAAALRSGKGVSAKVSGDVARVRRDLERKIRDLEKENAALGKKLAAAEKRPRGEQVKEDPFRDRNLRLLTEQLVKKEREIRGLADDVTALKKEKKGWERAFGPREKRMAELDILVNTLMKQLGDYSAMIEKRDVNLRAGAKQIASLTEDLEAQKAAALALQKELAEARARQERTLQKLTQLMSMNTDGVGPDDMDFNLYGPPTGFAVPQEKPEDPSKVRKRVDKLKRQVEVLMEKR